MSSDRVTAHAVIPASAPEVYATIADYHVGHPAILPKPYFRELVVEEGGVGAGTRIRVTMRVLGTTQTFRAVVSEPDPGRVLVETNDTGSVTTFTVTPIDELRSDVAITTELPPAKGLRGAIERRIAAAVVRRIFPEELALLARRHERGTAARHQAG